MQKGCIIKTCSVFLHSLDHRVKLVSKCLLRVFFQTLKLRKHGSLFRVSLRQFQSNFLRCTCCSSDQHCFDAKSLHVHAWWHQGRFDVVFFRKFTDFAAKTKTTASRSVEKEANRIVRRVFRQLFLFKSDWFCTIIQ